MPRFPHVLTATHALGAIACFIMAFGSALSPQFRDSLALSSGSRIMISWFGAYTCIFLLFLGIVLATLGYASWTLRPWAWHLTLIVYGIGVFGSLWQVSVGIPQGWAAAVVNGVVLTYASTPAVRRAYTRK